MKKIFSRYNIMRAALFLAGVFIVVYFLPRADSVKLSYEAGRPWLHPMLTAPFDVPVYRDSVTTSLLIDSIKKNFEPVYTLNNAPSDTLKTHIRRNAHLNSVQRQHLLATIDTLYQRGITDIETARVLKDAPSGLIHTVTGRHMRTLPANRVLTRREAYVFVDSVERDPVIRDVLQQIQFTSLLKPNIALDTVATSRLYNERIQPVTAAISVIQQGERIIDRGDVVTPQLDTILSTYERMAADRYQLTLTERIYTMSGQILMSCIIMALLFSYLFIFRKDIFDSMRSLTALLTLMLGFYVISVFAIDWLYMGIFLVPFAMIAILTVVFFDTSTALFVYVIEILACACLTTYPLELIFIEFSVGTITIFSMRELSRRSQLLRAALIAFVTYVVSYLAIEMMATATINTFSWRVIGYFAINMVLINFAYILIFVFEKLFGLISSVTLVELSDINAPLLKKLSEQCPGTFQHSMGVSNLAATAATSIGANVQLVRAGALYHDIGKINNPAFFTENQYGVNPHDALSPEQSARVLHNHVIDGGKMATKEKLPQVIKDLIAQHHGAGKAKYFYTKYQQQHPDEVIDDAIFQYPGPNPQTREASLLMMADAVEAASRSMRDHSPEAISKLVNSIVDGQVDDGLHRESPMSFRDIQLAKDSFINRLRTMYHSRIAYPSSAPKKA